MAIPHNALVVVADGSKLLILHNEGDAEYPNLQVVHKQEQDNPANRDQATDGPGRLNDGGVGRSAVETTDFHQIEEDRFADQVADLLYQRAHGGDLDKLILVAPPRLLGRLRETLHSEVKSRLIAEIDKDLTNHPPAKIEKVVSAAL
ncbi:Host attachment protein [Rhodothalassium salexigens]|uniref:host attachment family protein n=1 Tax=Rhodothalassium salexigens TaxID=1086 RepID=UPI001913C199|nr:host attachment family protein [Rhodothalassium salexigens]MBK5910031.1 Host attachment protein [Rhodothalassium salexigens]